MNFLRTVPMLLLGLLAGCSSEVTLRFHTDPSARVLNDSVAVVYDADARGLWYVIVVRVGGLLAAGHRHEPGMHIYVSDGDLIFFSRCSGRGETLDVMGQPFNLKSGGVFLCDVENQTAHVIQMRQMPPPCRPNDPESVAGAIYQLSTDPRIASFLGEEAHARLLADWEIAKDRKRKAGGAP